MTLADRLRDVYEHWGFAAKGHRILLEAADALAWHPISDFPPFTLRVTTSTLLCAHNTKRWIRFGKYYVQERSWYYSGTNERSQYNQTRGDEPTHWMHLPKGPWDAEDRFDGW